MFPEGDESSPAPDVSSTPAPEATPAAAPSPDPSPSPAAEPPAGQSGKTTPESMLDAVLKVVPADNQKDVLAPEVTASPETPAEQPVDPAAEHADEDDDDAEPPADAGSPTLRKKIAKLLKQRHELRETVQEMEALRPSAEIGQSMQEFAAANKLDGEDVARVLQLGAMLRMGDYAGFYKAVAPFVRTAQEYLGLVLPKDLSDRVKAGQMTEAAAKDFARTRMDGQRGQLELREQQQVQATTQLANIQTQVTNSVSAYERQLAAADPDYKAKSAAVRRTAQAMLLERGGRISGVQEALDITKAAYEEVNASMRKLRPTPASTAPKPNGNGSTMAVAPEPKSLMEAALQGLARSRNGAGHP